MRALALLLSLLIAVPARAQSPFIFGGGGQAKALNQNGITLKTGQTLSYDGPDNWIKNGRAADPVIVGMGTYDDGASATPVDCTGGSPAQVSSPSIVSSEYQFVKAAADAQGEGIYIDIESEANIASTTAWLMSKFRTLSGTYATGDVGVYVYDVTNGGTPQKVYDIGESGTTKTDYALTWVTSSTSTTYRACIHVQTTSASAYTLGFDNLYAGIEKNGPVQTMPYQDSIAWNPTGSWVSNTTYTGTYWQRGNLFQGQVLVSVSGTPTSANLTINMPSGLTIDETNMRAGSAKIVGTARIFDASGSPRFTAFVAYSPGANTSLTLVYPNQNVNTDTDLNRMPAITQAAPITFATGDYIDIVIQGPLPIVEWSTSANVSPAAQCEYAATSGTWDGSSSTTVFGINGQPMAGALSTVREKTITFTKPVKFLRVLLSSDRTVWVPANMAYLNGAPVINSFSATGTDATSSGVYAGKTSTYQAFARFFRYQWIANDDSPTGDWPSSNAYWVVENCPTAQGGIVYAMAETDGSAGLVAPYSPGTGVVYSGTYTPTLTGTANLDAVSSNTWVYTRVGSIVTVSGEFTADPTAGAPTSTTFTATLPVVRTGGNFANSYEATGTMEWSPTNANTLFNAGEVIATTSAQTVTILWAANGTTSRRGHVSFMYELD